MLCCAALALCCVVLFCLVLSCLVLPCLVLSCVALPCLVLSSCVVMYSVVFCVFVCCLMLSCVLLSCAVLCPVVLCCLFLSNKGDHTGDVLSFRSRWCLSILRYYYVILFPKRQDQDKTRGWRSGKDSLVLSRLISSRLFCLISSLPAQANGHAFV